MTQDGDPIPFVPTWVWGVPFAPFTAQQALEMVRRLVERRTPSYFVTANLHYCMLTAQEPRLPEINDRAAFILADGMPIVWAARTHAQKLPERVAGSDLISWMCELAAEHGYRVYFLGGGPGIAEAAAEKVRARIPNVQIVGTECPPFRKLTPEEEEEQIERIRSARPDMLFVAFGQPKGEFWIADRLERLGVPVCVQIGASLDFLAGRVQRAPRWVQKIGMEWFYRITREPSRMAPRYFRNGLFLARMLVKDLIGDKERRRA